VAFPLLLMVDTRLAWAALAGAIVMIVRNQLRAARTTARRRLDHDASI
jgi:hypothetical protein